MSVAFDQSVAGDNDSWILFERLTSDGYPLVVLARTGNPLVETALQEGSVTAVHCRADAAIVNDIGMPQHTDRIYPVEDRLALELGAFDIGALHVASVSGDGERRMIYSHARPINFTPILDQLSVEGYALSAASLTDRPALIELVTPTIIDRKLHGDQEVISNLQKHGDDGSTARKTDFWFYGEKDRLLGLIRALEPWGYSVDHWLDDSAGVVLTTETPVEFGIFREVTPVLVGMAERHGVEYDGWETPVVGAAAAQSEPPKSQPKSLLSKLFRAKKN